MPAPRRKMTSPSKCGVPGCGRRKVARGLCGAHYKRWKRSGLKVAGPEDWEKLQEVLAPPVKQVDPDRGCSVPGCVGSHRALGLCSTHYKRRWRERLSDLQSGE